MANRNLMMYYDYIHYIDNFACNSTKVVKLLLKWILLLLTSAMCNNKQL